MEDTRQASTQVTSDCHAERCPVCNGHTTVNWGRQICPACKGNGFIIVPNRIEEGRRLKDAEHKS